MNEEKLITTNIFILASKGAGELFSNAHYSFVWQKNADLSNTIYSFVSPQWDTLICLFRNERNMENNVNVYS